MNFDEIINRATATMPRSSTRNLYAYEIRAIRAQCHLRPYRGKQWQIQRDEKGDYNLVWRCKDGTGATWKIKVTTKEAPRFGFFRKVDESHDD